MASERVSIERAPTIKLYYPVWWDHHGMGMQLRPEQSNHHRVVVDSGSNGVAVLRITRAESPRPLWVATWNIRQSPSEVLYGETLMGEDTLKGAFGMDNITPRGSEWLIERYGGTSAEEGRYIRYRDFLNVSGPGTPSQGRPNISVELDARIKSAIGDLLKAS